ncbi:MAG: ATP-dependent protease ATPase subunit HslU [Clostridia bacterium]|nr:ATP-dependent protease ATPase subunit HslU [Clostridia bacterium]
MDYLTPKEIVKHLDKYIVGQGDAKKAVAIALRNRYRRKQLSQELQEEIFPKNIIMIGPTGVGKTEIARRLAKLVNAPFIKIEATKFTEVGYVGRDVESIIRDLVETSIRMVKTAKREKVLKQAEKGVEDRLIDIIMPLPTKSKTSKNPLELLFGTDANASDTDGQEQDFQNKVVRVKEQREILRNKLKRLELEEELIEIEVQDNTTPTLEIFSGSGMEEMGINFQDMLGGILPKKSKKKKLPIKEAKKILLQQEADKLIDMDEVVSAAINAAEQEGIVFLDEIDKIALQERGHGPDVSRGGVQRDILPIVEGSTVMTKHGPVKTDHILFIAAGAFHTSKPSDLIPELQGRFPIRVELQSLTKDDFKQILTEPKNSLIKQYTALLETEGIKIDFIEDAISTIAEIGSTVNAQTENIGARRLHTILEKLLEDLFYDAPEIDHKNIVIDKKFVEDKLNNIVQDQDLSRYIL